MASPRHLHMAAVKRIIRYVNVLFIEGYATLLELHLYMPIVMLIMLGAQILEDLLLDDVCSLVLHLFHEDTRNKIGFLNP